MSKQIPLLLFAFANERQSDVDYLRALSDERRAIEAALDSAVRTGLCEVKILPNATLGEIFAVFQDDRSRDRIALFHYGGHAGSLELLLEKNDRENAAAHRTGLVPFLKNQKGLEMVFLNGCSTEQWALALNEAGIPLVAGTFQAIRDNVAQQLAAQFYAGIGQGLPLRRAWDEAVARIRTESGDNLRSLERDGQVLDRFPWELFQRKGADQTNQWNLPDAVGNPLAALPLTGSYQQAPLPNDPFRFLDRYRKTDAPVFFGRGHDIRDLCDRLANPVGSPVVLLSGQSGVGKSSLLEAGLLPRLEDRYTVLYLRRDAETNLRASLKAALRIQGDGESDLRAGWGKIEQQHGKPLIGILDQVEEAFTRDGGQGIAEVEALADALHDLFGDAATRPQGKLLLGFRKEYEAEIEDVLKQQKIDYTSVFLKRLSRDGILEVVNGLSSSPRLSQKYGLRIEAGLPETIAADLLSDSDTPVSPVLQIILTKLWENKGEDRIFTRDKYLELKEDGIFLGDFFRQQMEKLRAWEQKTGKDVESSGLALDVLNSHTTDLGFANSRSMAEITQAYQHRADVLADLIKQFKDLYLLTDAGDQRNALAHDTLAPVVLQEVKTSDRPGQKALRILAGKTANYRRNTHQTFIDEADLALVERGRTGMRLWMENEPALIKKSQNRRAALRRQRRLAWSTLLLLGLLAAWFGYANYQQNRIERWVSQARLEATTDPTLAMRTLQKAIDFAPENPAVMAALNDIWSNNEFYEHALLHPDPVQGVILAPDSSGMLYAWTEKTVYRWSVEGVKKDTFATQDISAVALSPDGRFLVVGTQDGHLARLDAATLQQAGKADLFGDDYATHLVFSTTGEVLFASNTANFIATIATDDFSTTKSRFEVNEEVSGLAVHPYRNTLLLGYASGQAEERSVGGAIIRALSSHKDQVLSFAVSPLDSSVVSAGRDAELLFQGAGRCTGLTLKGHDRRINDIKWSPDGSRLFSAGHDNLIKTWSPEGDLISVYRGHKGFVNALSVSNDGRYFASSGEDGMVQVWKTESKVLQRYGPHLGGVSGILLSKDNKKIMTTSDAGINDIAETINDRNFNLDDLIDLQFGIAPRGVFLWDVLKGRQISEWKGHKGGINGLACDNGGEMVITASDDWTAIVWDGNGVPAVVLSKGHSGKVLDVAASPDGQHICTVGEDSLAILWDKNGAIIRRIPQPDLVSAVAFSPNGALFATGCYDGGVRLYDTKGIEKGVLQRTDSRRVEAICFSPDGQLILAGEWGNSARIYTLTGDLVCTLVVSSKNKTGGEAIKSVAFSPNGKDVCLGAEGGLAQVFRLMENRQVLLRTLQHFPPKAILSLEFTPDGKGVLTGSNDHWGRWWKFE